MFKNISMIDKSLSTEEKELKIRQYRIPYNEELGKFKPGTKQWRMLRCEETLLFEWDIDGRFINKINNAPMFDKSDYIIDNSKQLLNGELLNDVHQFKLATRIGLVIFEDREVQLLLKSYIPKELIIK